MTKAITYAAVSQLTITLTRSQRQLLHEDARNYRRHTKDHAVWIVLRHLGLVDEQGMVLPVNEVSALAETGDGND